MAIRKRYVTGLSVMVACAAPGPASPHAEGARSHGSTLLRADESRVRTSRVIVTPTEAYSVRELYAHASDLAAAGNWGRAAREFDRVYELDRAGPLAAVARYDAGVAYDESSSLRASQELALERFRGVVSEFPAERWAGLAIVRALRLAVHLERWSLADTLVSESERLRVEPSPSERSLAAAARALHSIELGRLDAAGRFVEDGIAVVEEYRLDTLERLPRDVAALYFALGELKRARAERIKFVPAPADFATSLERRCQLLLDAQRAYAGSMRAYDAHWSSMAGVRTSELYLSLHRDLMQIPPPASATDKASTALFQGAMRLRYSILLEKALTMIEHTLQEAPQETERTGEQTEWVERAREARTTILDAKRLEDAAVDALPYSRDQLRKALEALRQPKAEVQAP